jgi:hypothetical protein
MVADLFLRYLWLHGTGTLAALHEKLMLSFPSWKPCSISSGSSNCWK